MGPEKTTANADSDDESTSAPFCDILHAEALESDAADVPSWSIDRTVNLVDMLTLLATILLAFAAVWYFEPRHSRRAAAFDVFSGSLQAATDGIGNIEGWILRDAPANRHDCSLLLVYFRGVGNALWLLGKFAERRRCRPAVCELVHDMASVKQALYDHLTGIGFPADSFTLDAQREVRATSLIGQFRMHAMKLKAELVDEL